MRLWGGRFEDGDKEGDEQVAAFGRSIDVDRELAIDDLDGSVAHVRGLGVFRRDIGCTGVELLLECGVEWWHRQRSMIERRRPGRPISGAGVSLGCWASEDVA